MKLRSPFKLGFLRPLAAASVFVSTLTAVAQHTWTGGGTDDNWSTPENWQGGIVPTDNNLIVFAGNDRTTNVNDLTITNLGAVRFDSPNWHISGNAVTKLVNTGWTNGVANSTAVWDVPTTLGSANGTIYVSVPSYTASLVFPNVISGANASRHLRKLAGASAVGKLSLLNPANTFLGQANLGSGVSEFVKVANVGQPSSLGAYASSTAVGIIIGATGTSYATDSSYIGTEDGETDRIIEFQGRVSVAFNNNSPNNSSLTFNNEWRFRPSTTPPRLTLGGTSTGTNTVNANLVQSVTTLPFGLDVNGPTTWVFNGANSLLGDFRIRSGKHYLGSTALINSTNLSISPGAAMDVSAMATGLPVGMFGGQILTAGRNGDVDTDIFGSLDLGFYGVINVGGLGSPATMKLSGNLRATTGTLVMDVSDQAGVNGGNDLLDVGGDLDLSGVTLNLNPYAGGLVTGVPYTLFKYGGSLIGTMGLNVPQPARAFTATVSTTTPGEVQVIFSPSGQTPANLVWQGGIWDAGVSQSWLNGANFDYFQQLDAVTFNDTAWTFDVPVSAVVAPASITVDTTNTYTIQGAGSLSGGAAGMITKRGSGTLKILTANILSSPILVSAGALVGGNSTALGSGNATLGDATTGTNDITLLLSSAATFPGAVDVTANGTGMVILGRESGGSVNFSGPVTLSRDVVLTNPGPFASSSRLYISGLISGEGNITASGGGYFTLNPATDNTFAGDVMIRDEGTVFQIDSGRGLPSTCNVDVGSGANLQPYGNLTINSLTGSGMLRGVSGTYTLTVGQANGDGVFTGSIVHNTQGGVEGILNLRKVGTGTLFLSGDSSGSRGSTTVAEGVLAVTNELGSGISSGALLVEAAGTLAGTGLIDVTDNNATINGMLSVGLNGDTAGETFTVTNTAALIFGGGTLEVDLFSGAGAGDNTANPAAADILMANCAVTLEAGATLTVGNPGGLTGFALGDKWKLINWNSAPNGTFTTLNLPPLPAGLGWDLSELYSTGAIAVGAAAVQPQIGLDFNGSQLTLTWTGEGVLQSAPEVTGEFTDIVGATSPYVITDFSAPRLFFRVRLP